MSRTGTRDTNAVPKDKVAAFVTLLDKIAARLGSTERACAACGINSGQWLQIRQGLQNLPVSAGRRILHAYRDLKATT